MTLYATHSAATDPKPDFEFALDDADRATAAKTAAYLEYNRRCANARANGTPMPPKPEGV